VLQSIKLNDGDHIMKAFIAYRHKGEDPERLLRLLTAVRDGLTEAGVNAYCTFFDDDTFKDKGYKAREIMDHAFKKIGTVDVLFVIMNSDEKSEGMLMQIGYCIAKEIPVVVAVKDTVKSSYVPDMAAYSIVWSDIDDLTHKIGELPLLERKI
jgi:nucleoside 2-deoxyribosyltransferase